MKKSFLKLLLFISVIFVLIASLKINAYYRIVNNPSFKPFFHHTISDSNFYFIGTSRMRESFDEKLFKQKIPGYSFHNLGISALPMNYGLLLANKIISNSNNDNHNAIYIEISRFKPYRSARCYDLFTYSDVIGGLKSYNNSINTKSFNEFKSYVNDLSEFTLIFFSLTEELVTIINPDLGITKLANSRIEKSFIGDCRSIIYLNPIDIESANKNVNFNKSYQREIFKTIENGEKKNIKIIFLLPIVFSSAEEKKELLPLFNSIPAKNKLIYSEKFLKEICQTKNLYDDIHFNTNGSFVFSNELTKEINKLNEKNN